MAALKLVNLRHVRLALLRLEAELPHAWTAPTWNPTNQTGVQVRTHVLAAVRVLNAYLDTDGEPPA